MTFMVVDSSSRAARSMNKGKATANILALQGAIFNLKAQIAYKLQDIAYQTEELIDLRAQIR